MSFLIPQIFHYPFSWDIAKWFLVFEVSARVLVVAVFWPWFDQNLIRKTVAWIFTLLCILTPLQLLLTLASGSTRPYAWPTFTQVQAPEVLHPLIEKMKACESCRGMIWGTMDTASMVSNHTGYPVAQVDAPTITMPIPREIIQKRQQDIARLNSQPSQELLRSLAIRWVFFQCAELGKMPAPARDFIQGLKSRPGAVDYSIQNNPQGCYFILDLGELR